MEPKGRFISFEGGEGVGKSTLMDRLSSWLLTKRQNVITTREPGGTSIADAVRQIFKRPPNGEEMFAETELLLVSAARAQHVREVLRPALERGAWVLCDRYADSSRVYQGLLGGVPLNDVEWVVRFSTNGLEPELTFLLDCDVEISTARILGEQSTPRDNAVRFDFAEKEVHERLRRGFRRVAGFFPTRFYILDAGQSSDQVFEDAKAELERRWFPL